MSQYIEPKGDQPSLLVVRDRTDRHPDVPVLSQMHGDVMMESLRQEDPECHPYLDQLPGDPDYDARKERLPGWLLAIAHRESTVYDLVASYLYGHRSLEDMLLALLRIAALGYPLSVLPKYDWDQRPPARTTIVEPSTGTEQTLYLGGYDLGREPFDLDRLKHCWETGEDCPELERLKDEVDIAAAEEGVDRDHNGTELEAWREKRLEEMVHRALERIDQYL